MEHQAKNGLLAHLGIPFGRLSILAEYLRFFNDIETVLALQGIDLEEGTHTLNSREENMIFTIKRGDLTITAILYLSHSYSHLRIGVFLECKAVDETSISTAIWFHNEHKSIRAEHDSDTLDERMTDAQKQFRAATEDLIPETGDLSYVEAMVLIGNMAQLFLTFEPEE